MEEVVTNSALRERLIKYIYDEHESKLYIDALNLLMNDQAE